MHFNMRHFVVTIVSIFLALGIGIAIGATIDGQQLFIEEQGRLVEQIEKSIADVKEENNELKKERDDYSNKLTIMNEFFDRKLNQYVKENTLDKSVLVIDLYTSFGHDSVKDILKDLGTQRVDELKINVDYSNKNLEALTALKDEFNISGNNRQQIHSMMISALFSEVENFDRIANLLIDVGAIDVKGGLENISTSYDYVVIADNSENISVDNFVGERKMIIDNLNGFEIPLMAVESSESENTVMHFYKDQRVSTVDNIDESTGKLSMILIMNGESGNFGIKDTADYILPIDGIIIKQEEEVPVDEASLETIIDEEFSE